MMWSVEKRSERAETRLGSRSGRHRLSFPALRAERRRGCSAIIMTSLLSLLFPPSRRGGTLLPESFPLA